MVVTLPNDISFVLYIKISPFLNLTAIYILIIMLPLAAIERIARKAGVERISADAIRELSKTIEELGADLALEAAQAAKHAKRKTVLKEDIRLIAGKA
jgi:histone H3/H4